LGKVDLVISCYHRGGGGAGGGFLLEDFAKAGVTLVKEKLNVAVIFVVAKKLISYLIQV